MPHQTGTPTKRKLVADLHAEKIKRTKLEDELETVKNSVSKMKAKNSELTRQNVRLANKKKNEQGVRGRCKGKDEVGRSQKYKRRKQEIENVQETLQSLCNDKINSISVVIEGEDGKEMKVTVEGGILHRQEYTCTDDDLDEMVFIMDNYNIPVRGYHDLSCQHANLPRSYQVNNRRKDVNQTAGDILDTKGRYEGVWKSLADSLKKELSDPKREHLIQDGKVRIKFSGDGTRVGERKNFVNIAYTIIGEDTCTSYEGNYLLGIAKCPESGDVLKETFEDLFEEFINLDTIEVNGKTIHVEKFLGGDLKFLNQVMGIDSFNSEHCCLWCKSDKKTRHDMTKHWSMSDPEKGARTVEEITQCSKERDKSKKFNCHAPPLFRSIPVVHVVPDTLHLFMRIADQLVGQVISRLQVSDSITRVTKKHLEHLDKFTNISRFQNFIHDIGIRDWHFGVKDSKLSYRSFTGVEHRKIIKHIDLKYLIPNDRKLTQICDLWKNFEWLSSRWGLKLSDSEIDEFESKAKQWVSDWFRAYQAKDATPYMHVMAYHLPEAMRLYGNIGQFCQQGLEKLNDFVTKWYFKSTNFGKNALKQVMLKQHRIQTLQGKCARNPKWKVKCSVCKESGHNKRTCVSIIGVENGV